MVNLNSICANYEILLIMHYNGTFDKMKNINITLLEQFQNQIENSRKRSNRYHYMSSHILAWYTHSNKEWRVKTSLMGPNFPSYCNGAVIQVFSTYREHSKVVANYESGVRGVVFYATFNNNSYIVVVSFIGGGNWSTWRKPTTCRKSLTHFFI